MGFPSIRVLDAILLHEVEEEIVDIRRPHLALLAKSLAASIEVGDQRDTFKPQAGSLGLEATEAEPTANPKMDFVEAILTKLPPPCF